jgi:SIR2-like domain
MQIWATRPLQSFIAMLNADDTYTPVSLYRLKDVIRQRRPLVLWIGAGASRWAGLPSWHDSATKMRKTFTKSIPNFPDDLAKSHIASGAYPDLFQLCKETDSSLYNSILLKQFSSPAIGQIYEQFLEGLKKLAPRQIVTTNVDLCLEQHLGTIDVIERTDLERCGNSLNSGTSFVAKLHGSLSSIESTIFAKSDYQQIMCSEPYLAAMRSIFSISSVVFMGYGVRDEYVLKLLAENIGEHQLFGNGPHFLVSSTPGPPENGVHRIGYKIVQHPDHRAALTVLNIIEQQANAPVFEVVSVSDDQTPPKKETGFYISSFFPSGTHISGQALELGRPEEDARTNALVGLGFAQSELLNSETVAFHDLAVGLICFDRVFLTLSSLALLHDRATPEVFWALMDSDAINFVDVIHDPLFVSTPDSPTGGVAVVRIQGPEHKGTRSSMSVVRKMLKPAPGREEEGDKKIEGLASRVVSFADSERLNLAGMVRDALLLPRVSQLLGYSDYAETNKIPRWLAYPTLRFAHLVQTGLICNQLNISASRVPFGGISLLSAAFSIKPAEQTVFDYAGFVMAGTFGSNLSSYLEVNPRSFLILLKFRESAEGETLRKEVSDRLDTNDGTEFSSSVEGSLKRAIPAAVLQAVRNKFSTLMKAANASASAEVIWANNNTDDSSLRLWRERSRELLLSEAKARGVQSASPCLCGSGDRLRDCCLRPLR